MSDFDEKREQQHMDPDANEPWQIVKQTEGLDADETRRVAGPDWEPGTQGDVDAETGGTTQQGGSDPGASSSSQTGGSGS